MFQGKSYLQFRFSLHLKTAISRLTQEVLNIFPQHRQNKDMMYTYLFVIEFLESAVRELQRVDDRTQALFKELIILSKDSEENLRKFLSNNIAEVRFNIYSFSSRNQLCN